MRKTIPWLIAVYGAAAAVCMAAAIIARLYAPRWQAYIVAFMVIIVYHAIGNIYRRGRKIREQEAKNNNPSINGPNPT